MIKISEEEFEVLKLREKNYSCVTIKRVRYKSKIR